MLSQPSKDGAYREHQTECISTSLKEIPLRSSGNNIIFVNIILIYITNLKLTSNYAEGKMIQYVEIVLILPRYIFVQLLDLSNYIFRKYS